MSSATIGIEEDLLEKDFERNYSTKDTGNGMELHIVKRICDQCGWNVGLTSTPGSGTLVTIEFAR